MVSAANDAIQVTQPLDKILLICIIFALLVVIIMLICSFTLVMTSHCLMLPHYRSSADKIPIRSGDVENTGGTHYETDVGSFQSNLPILQHNMGHSRISSTPTSSIIGNCSLDLYADFQQPHFFPSLLPSERRYGSSSFGMKTEDLVSDVTDASLERKSFNYENIYELRVPPPSVVTNDSEVLLSVRYSAWSRRL